ncbi:MAG: hypothetical protein ACUVRS_04980 [Armatimonadota bacterium]
MKKLIIAITHVICTILCSSALAVEVETGYNVLSPKDEARHEDLLAAALKARIESRVNGDLTAITSQGVQVSGKTTGYVFLIGQNVDLGGAVQNDAWLLGQNINIRSRIDDNVYAAGSAVVVSPKSRIENDLYTAGGTVNIRGNIGRDVHAIARTVIIDGTIGGNVRAKANHVKLLDHAVINGNLYYETPNPLFKSPQAKVTGKIVHKLPPKPKTKPVFWSNLVKRLQRFVAAVLFGGVLIAAFPRAIRRISNKVRHSFWPSLGIGLVAVIVIPIASVIALITLIGAPLGLVGLCVYVVSLYVSGLFVSLALGEAILAKLAHPEPSRLLALILGAAILGVTYAIPWIGWFAKITAILTGLGAFCLSVQNIHQSGATPSNPPDLEI